MRTSAFEAAKNKHKTVLSKVGDGRKHHHDEVRETRRVARRLEDVAEPAGWERFHDIGGFLELPTDQESSDVIVIFMMRHHNNRFKLFMGSHKLVDENERSENLNNQTKTWYERMVAIEAVGRQGGTRYVFLECNLLCEMCMINSCGGR